MVTSFLNTCSFAQNELKKVNLVSNEILGSYLSFPMIIWLTDISGENYEKSKIKIKKSKKKTFQHFSLLLIQSCMENYLDLKS